jgi:lactoylglutathione lyase
MLRAPFIRAQLRVATTTPSYKRQIPRLTRFFTTASPITKMPATAETASYRFNHTMFRIKDPEKSLKFYQDTLGMDLIDEHDGGDFKLFFLGYGHQKGSRGEREALLELTWNKGTEKQSDFSYASGNEDVGKGFGHIAISVDSVEDTCDRLTKLGVQFKKRPEDGEYWNGRQKKTHTIANYGIATRRAPPL